MMSGAREHLREQAATEAPVVTGSTTSASSPVERPADSATPADMFGDVPAHVRMKMELIAHASASPELALAPVIDLLVEGGTRKRAAIVDAISTNEPLREQWERTWGALRR